jgi:hypothetical protein
MDEESNAEPELSEEQLGEISGGCRSCSWDRGVISRARARLAAERAGLEHAQNTGNHALAQLHSRAYEQQAELITSAQERIVERGHGYLLSPPYTDRPYVPDLNGPPAR